MPGNISNNSSSGIVLTVGNVGVQHMGSEKKKDEANGNIKTASDDTNLTLKICKNFNVDICKPLIPLKLALFCFYGGGAVLQIFLPVFYKQRGLTLSELSAIYIVSPVVQFLGPTLSGIIVDKLGRSKPVLIANMLISVALILCVLHVPGLKVENCPSHEVNLTCNNQRFEPLMTISCYSTHEIELKSCNIHCEESSFEHCNGKNFSCDFPIRNEFEVNFTITADGYRIHAAEDKCFFNISSIFTKPMSNLSCYILNNAACYVSCFHTDEDQCISKSSGRTPLLVVNVSLLLLLYTILSNCYRCMDVTSMDLVKVHNSDFGFQRFFSITGSLVSSPFAGLIVSMTTPEGADKNYSAALYFFIATTLLSLIAFWKLNFVTNSPGKKMWRKTWNLMKNPDNFAFLLVLFIMGSEWGFAFNFRSWYLEELGGTSVLLGLTTCVFSLFSLPLLLTSKWWIRKIGSTSIFVLAFLGYTLYGVGYSFLRDPWFALILETTVAFSFQLLWVAVVVHSQSIAPEGLVATVISGAGAIHYSIGKSAGSLIGGLVMSALGGRSAYRVMAALSFVSALLYSSYLAIRRKYYAKKKDIYSKNDTDPEGKEKYMAVIGTYTLRNKV